jgi:hypothetical protein
MNVSDDKDISREALKGFYMFMHSESLRHLEDVRMIGLRMYAISKRIELTPEERKVLKKEALKYVSF